MREYSTFIAFSTLFDALPTTSQYLSQVAKNLFNPMVTIVEANCFTQLGKQISVTLTTSGYTEAISGVVIDSARAQYLLSQGIYSIGVRSVSTCTSSGGICQTCYHAEYGITPSVGSTLRISPPSTLPYFGYLANSYAGSLIGALPLPTDELPINQLLLVSMISDTVLLRMEKELRKFTFIPELNLDYLSYISDNLEKALYILILYGVFGQQQ